MSFIHTHEVYELEVQFERVMLESIICDPLPTYQRTMRSKIEETIRYCKGETNIHTIQRNIYLTVMRWYDADKDFFLNLDVENIRLIDWLYIRNLPCYGEKLKHRMTYIQEILDDEN
jgi:hypothetical protein